ncbi:hypothetical protein [Pseudomonas sp. 31 R 17]|uniref:hypothetical protein n=1 Tax=Pseudomonas sp. 31 R 17 TaxID=1844101 RepID=UPI00114782F6|nr:hypothetical protein [Pseudomonas sp. 31 R 17]
MALAVPALRNRGQKKSRWAFSSREFLCVWRETRDSNAWNAINVRRFSRPLCKFKRADVLKAVGVPLPKATDQATDSGGYHNECQVVLEGKELATALEQEAYYGGRSLRKLHQ